MKRLFGFFVSLILVFNCQNHESGKDKQKKLFQEYVYILAAQNLQTNNPQYQASSCTDYSQPLNPAYPGAWPTFHNDTTQYTTVIIGDSTMAIAETYSGFVGAGTQDVAVSGNTMCDMITQLPAINTVSPSVVLVATTGGNDMLHGFSDVNVINTGTLLIQAIKAKFPNAKLVMIAVHPTENSYANAHKAAVNTGVQNALSANYSVSTSCFYNPLPLFGVAEGQPAPTSDMLPNDSVHYNQSMTFQIKNAVQTACSITY